MFDEEVVTALRDSGGDQDFALFPENHRFQVPADAHWQEIRKVSRDVGRALQQAMRAIETANPDKLFGIFGDAQWTNKDRLSDAMLRDLIEHFSTLELTVANLPEDELGQGYEYLIKKFAADSGHTAAEFYTNRTVVHLMTEMLDVQPGESVYDPTCGSGGMLLSCVAHLRNQKKEWRNVKLYGQERNLMTSSIALMNCYVIVERIVTDIDAIVKQVRFDGWQVTVQGEREVKQALRRALLKYKLHTDQELFDKSYSYIRQYY